LQKFPHSNPNEPINIKPVLRALPENMTVPELPGWQWIHVPGQAPGQVALFRDRDRDRILVSADAFITVKQDAMYNVLVQKKEVCGPPVYLTTDWTAAYNSAKKLQALQPAAVVPGHGTAMEGAELTEGLNDLIQNWNEVAVPNHGKFVTDKNKEQ
jgi:glyoxylase-like metal-dependent hydrolase (beta-lactamase superfamily II)